MAALDRLIAALVHLGMPREIATRLGERVLKENTPVTVHATTQEEAERVRVILAANNPCVASVSPAA